jgi:DDE superfamily endonuclease
MAAVRAFAVGRLGDPADAVLMIDESGQEKAGEHTAGVQRQYLGCAGRVANGINVVYASYAAPAGHAIIGARLYVPRGWAGDRERRLAAGIPDDLPFKTKPQLAAEMIRQVRGWTLPALGDRRRSLRPGRQPAAGPGRPGQRVCAEDPLLVPRHAAHRAEGARRSRGPPGPGRCLADRLGSAPA